MYDFDGTIFPGDCAIGFAFWCMNRHPKLWITYFPRAIRGFIQHKRGKMPNFRLQSKVFSYLTQVDDFDGQIERYWDKNEGKIAPLLTLQNPTLSILPMTAERSRILKSGGRHYVRPHGTCS